MYLREARLLETVASATGIVNLARKFAEEYAGDSPIKAAVDNGDELSSKLISTQPGGRLLR